MNLQKQQVWSWKIVLYLFLAGLGAGTFMIAAVIDLVFPEANVKLALGIAGPIVIISTFFLLADLGQKKMFFKAFKQVGSSWIARGTWILTGFIIVSLVNLLIKWMFQNDGNPVLAVIGIILGGATAIYTGMLVGTMTARPTWNNAIIPVMFLISALTTGLGLNLMLIVSSGQSNSLIHLLVTIDIILLVLEILIIYFYLTIIAKTDKAVTHSLLKGNLALPFWVGLIVVGLIGPLILEYFSLSSTMGDVMTFVAGVAILIGGFFLRYIVLAIGVRKPVIVKIPFDIRPGY